MNTLLIIGADGWLGNALKQEINKEFLESLDIKQIIMHSKEKEARETQHNKNYSSFLKFDSIQGDFLIKRTFEG